MEFLDKFVAWMRLLPDVYGLHTHLLLLALPVLLAAISRRFSVFLIVSLLMLLALVVLTRPESASMVLVAAAFVGSLIFILDSILIARRARATDLAISRLQHEVNELLEAESQRIMINLKSHQVSDKPD